MRKPPGVIRTGTARDLADHGVGYTANGESEHSRRAAQPGSNVTLRSGAGLLNIKGRRTVELNLACNEVEVLRMKAALCTETNPTRRQKLVKNLEIKGAFCERLRAELRA